ncbi:hypothetical protein CT676_42140 [Bradyrhizobium sp. MOS001]|uniref:zinc-binding dehydrogenase n=1 Tax=Bradyrhizobium sp. MOS001 TaxID=2133948 RepID=UPI001074D802|nr:zinc-binding dehydrogenase [Bradyrhizobium sp. MOS001]TFW52588.1 hypothetical protein CT676_42140 [Bradyrhizobium sp. MOS001]
MRARHPAWFREDLARLFKLLAARAVQPRVVERISFAEVAEAHRRLEAGGCRTINENANSRRRRDLVCRQARSILLRSAVTPTLEKAAWRPARRDGPVLRV